MKEERKFSSKRTVTTARINEAMAEDKQFFHFVRISLGRHFRGDWGEMDEEDKAQNEIGLKTATAMMMSVYIFHKGQPDEKKIWIITEWDRSVTTVLFPDEY